MTSGADQKFHVSWFFHLLFVRVLKRRKVNAHMKGRTKPRAWSVGKTIPVQRKKVSWTSCPLPWFLSAAFISSMMGWVDGVYSALPNHGYYSPGEKRISRSIGNINICIWNRYITHMQYGCKTPADNSKWTRNRYLKMGLNAYGAT
jgi:hypothetical protein